MNTPSLSLIVSHDLFAICRLRADERTPDWLLSGSFYSLTRTPDELSIVCLQELVPEGVEAVGGWRSLKVEAKLGLTVVGILSSLASSLARAGISVFVISTYDTDYLFLRETDLDRGIAALRKAGHKIRYSKTEPLTCSVRVRAIACSPPEKRRERSGGRSLMQIETGT